MFPVEDVNCQKRLMQMLEFNLRDNIKARVLNSDGTYSRIDKRGKERFDAQQAFCELQSEKKLADDLVFQPRFEISSTGDG
jgi:polyphosphate kinase